MIDIDFQCTKCGDCCRGFKLPLSVAEAISWLQDGNPVEVLCEAIPWIDEPPPSNLAATFKRERSFAAKSGTIPIRVVVTLAAPLGSGCPNLSADNLCNIHDRRPRNCRIYPAEPIPFIELVPEQRRCPPEAWQSGNESFIRQGTYVDPQLTALVQNKLTQSIDDALLHSALCQALGISQAALANEGYVVHSPAGGDLLEALSSLQETSSESEVDWEFVSDNTETVELIRSCNGKGLLALDNQPNKFTYLSLIEKAQRE